MAEFTDEQKRAIYDRSDEILVSASAGSGKTTVMLERVFQLLQEGAQLSEMIICTFTNASCADIRKKLTEKLTRLLEQGSQAAEKALAQMPLADISTIDSLCAKICRNYFYYTSLDPMFEVLDGAKSKSLLASSMDEVFASLSQDSNFETLFDVFSRSSDDRRLKEMVEKVHAFASSQPDPAAWLAAQRTRAQDYGETQHLACLEEIKGWHEQGLFGSEALNSPSAACNKEHICALIDLVCAVQKEYAAKKEQRASFDFSDIAHAAYKILSHESGGDEVRKGYKYLFVDEFQDINPLQAELFLKLSEDAHGVQTAKRFYVGDVKQSIYCFRQSEPSIFVRRRDEIKRICQANPSNTKVQSLLLPHNFRSTKGVLDFCDSVFLDRMSEEFGGICYKDEAFHAMSATQYPSPIVCGLVVPHTPSKEEKAQQEARKKEKASEPLAVYGVQDHVFEQDEEYTSAQAQANWVAEHIANLVGSMFDENKDGKLIPRKVGYGDIAVLLRSTTTAFAARLLRTFEAAGIPYAFAGEFSPLTNPVICVLVSMLRLLDNRRDDIQLVAALKTPLGGFCSDSDLATIRTEYAAVCKSGAFWQACAWYQKFGSQDVLRTRLTELYNRLDAYRLHAASMDFAALASYVASDNLLFQYALALDDGALNAELLGQFLDILPSGMTLGEGLNALSSDGIKLSTAAQAGAVTVTTLHKAKGLEYPFVVLANLQQSFNDDDRTRADCILDNERGISMRFYDTDTYTIRKTSDWYCAEYASLKKQIEEEMRLLYVGLTRAIYQTALFAAPSKNYTQKLGINANCPLDFLYAHMQCDAGDGRFVRTPKECLPPKSVRAASAVPHLSMDASQYRRYTDFVYPHASSPVKTTVTRLSHSRLTTEPEVVYSGVVANKDSQGMRVGDAYHKFLEKYDYGAEFMVNWRTFQKDYPELFKLLQQSSAQSAVDNLRARIGLREIYRELPFFYNADGVWVQGVVDLLIDGGDGVEIIDYKTGNLTEQYLSIYQKQVALYAEAVTKTLGKKVVKQSLYGISAQKFVDFV